MEITLLNCTEYPIWTIGNAAGVCYGKHINMLPDYNVKRRVKTCFESGHLSVFEHASVTFDVRGISRACSHQLVRHRLASFCQQSQRYCKIEVGNDDWYVTPPDIWEDDWKYSAYQEMMDGYAKNYTAVLEEMKLKPEDARYLLPEAAKTELVVTMNCRELFHFFDLRLSQRAQWEIRELAEKIKNHLKAMHSYEGWAELMALYDGKR